jgi:hypothetical protein
MDVVFVDNGVCIRSIDITVRQNVEQGSISKLSSIIFDLCRKDVTVSRDDIVASFRAKVMFGSFVEGIGSLEVVVRVR